MTARDALTLPTAFSGLVNKKAHKEVVQKEKTRSTQDGWLTTEFYSFNHPARIAPPRWHQSLLGKRQQSGNTLHTCSFQRGKLIIQKNIEEALTDPLPPLPMWCASKHLFRHPSPERSQYFSSTELRDATTPGSMIRKIFKGRGAQSCMKPITEALPSDPRTSSHRKRDLTNDFFPAGKKRSDACFIARVRVTFSVIAVVKEKE